MNLLNQSPGNLLLFALLGAAVYFGTGAASPHPGTLVGLVLLTPSFMGAIQAIGSWRITKSQAGPALTLVNEILTSHNAATVVPDPATGQIDPAVAEVITPTLPDDPVPAPAATLRVNHLTFSYEPGTLPNVLDDVSFSVPPGKITGLVAHSGEGKTTFFRLGLRFYDAQRGTIELNGTPHTELELTDLRRRVVLMSRAPAFFQDTVRENLLLARPDATDEKLREECERTGIWPLLQERLTDGAGNPLDARFPCRGSAFRRTTKAFCADALLAAGPGVPLSWMSPLPAWKRKRSLTSSAPCAGAAGAKTVVVVDHDLLWQLRFCDYFLVLDGGKVVEHGTGRDLLGRHGAFRKLFDEQTAGVFKLLRTLQELGLIHPDPDRYAHAAYYYSGRWSILRMIRHKFGRRDIISG